MVEWASAGASAWVLGSRGVEGARGILKSPVSASLGWQGTGARTRTGVLRPILTIRSSVPVPWFGVKLALRRGGCDAGRRENPGTPLLVMKHRNTGPSATIAVWEPR